MLHLHCASLPLPSPLGGAKSTFRDNSTSSTAPSGTCYCGASSSRRWHCPSSTSHCSTEQGTTIYFHRWSAVETSILVEFVLFVSGLHDWFVWDPIWSALLSAATAGWPWSVATFRATPDVVAVLYSTWTALAFCWVVGTCWAMLSWIVLIVLLHLDVLLGDACLFSGFFWSV
jgi:hypothetical protein